jgi:capsular polysaccharide biosynthesis protein
MDRLPATAPTFTAPSRTDLPIREAAWDVQQFEPAAPIKRDFEVSLGGSFTDPVLRANFAKRERTQELNSYRLRDVTLDASLMLLLRGRARIPETRYLVSDDQYADTLVKPLPADAMDPAVHFVIAVNRAWYNYYHWLVQAVPAIDWTLRQRGQHRVSLVLPPLRPWQEETLALLGYQGIPRLTLNISSTYLLHQAEFSDLLGAGMPDAVSCATAATFRRLDSAVPWTHGAADEIYVARADAENRTAQNEAELIDHLDREGVRIIVPGALSVAEQIAAFRAARLIIGPHGAGLSNIAFCRPGSFVYELLPQHYPNSCFNRLAQSAGISYWADLFESFGRGTVHERTWGIDLGTVAQRLDALRARIAATPRIEAAMSFLKRTQPARPEETPASLPVTAPASREPLPARGRLARSANAMARLFARDGRQ